MCTLGLPVTRRRDDLFEREVRAPAQPHLGVTDDPDALRLFCLEIRCSLPVVICCSSFTVICCSSLLMCEGLVDYCQSVVTRITWPVVRDCASPESMPAAREGSFHAAPARLRSVNLSQRAGQVSGRRGSRLAATDGRNSFLCVI